MPAIFPMTAALALALLVGSASAADRLLTPPLRPQGFAGVGHAENHAHYDGLRNPGGMSCCNGRDCRPTIARNVSGFWEVMVNGEWRSDFDGQRVLSDAWLKMEQQRLRQPITGRWNTEAHVCASEVAIGSKTKATIYCVILADEWN